MKNFQEITKLFKNREIKIDKFSFTFKYSSFPEF